MNNNIKAFSLVEILIVIAILGILSSISVGVFFGAREKAYIARAQLETNSFNKALELYKIDNNDYPEDSNRNIPSGLEEYLSSNNWPVGPWPGSVYDWDNWVDPDDSNSRIYQISIRFCPAGGSIEECNFPKTDWAEDFDVNSSVYYCIEGACRSHINEDIDYPGYCLNCQ